MRFRVGVKGLDREGREQADLLAQEITHLLADTCLFEAVGKIGDLESDPPTRRRLRRELEDADVEVEAKNR